MPRLSLSVPKYRKHKASGQAFVPAAADDRLRPGAGRARPARQLPVVRVRKRKGVARLLPTAAELRGHADEKLAKRLLSNLRQRPTSIVIIDNAKNRGGAEISSPCNEANSLVPNITLRILGKSLKLVQRIRRRVGNSESRNRQG